MRSLGTGVSGLGVSGVGELRSAVDGVLAQDSVELADAALAQDLVELRRQIDRLEAVFEQRLGAFDARQAYRDTGAASSAAWLRRYCRLAPGDAAARVRAARRLRDQLPATRAALTEGEISWPHARVLSEHIGRTADRMRARKPIADAIADVDAHIAGAEPILVDAARSLDPRGTATAARYWQHTVDPDGFAADAEHAEASRYLHISPTWGGMVRIDGELPPEAGQLALAAIYGLAGRKGLTDGRTPAQRRADAFTDLCRERLDSGTLPRAGGEKPHLVVEVSLDTLERRNGCAPGQLARTGPISAETARRLACDAGITRIITGPDSQPLDVGRRTRTIPTAIRTALRHRDGGCRWPGCDALPEWTDAHHRRHWVDGGTTDLDNLVLLCRRHHRAVHEGLQPAPVGSPTERPPPDRQPSDRHGPEVHGPEAHRPARARPEGPRPDRVLAMAGRPTG